MRIAISKCTQCICNTCSKYNCPHPQDRCPLCYRLGLRYCHDCDWWEYYKSAPKRLKVSKKTTKSRDEIILKLDYLIENLGLVGPAMEQLNNTHDVLYCDMVIARFPNYKLAREYVFKMQSEFKKPLQIVQVKIDL